MEEEEEKFQKQKQTQLATGNIWKLLFFPKMLQSTNIKNI